MHNFPQAYSLKGVNFKEYGISSFDFISSVKHRDSYFTEFTTQFTCQAPMMFWALMTYWANYENNQ